MLSAELPKFLWASNLLTFMNRVARPRATSSVLCMMLEGVGEGEVFHVNRQPSTAQQSKTTKVKQPSTKKSKKWTKCELSVKYPKQNHAPQEQCLLPVGMHSVHRVGTAVRETGGGGRRRGGGRLPPTVQHLKFFVFLEILHDLV